MSSRGASCGFMPGLVHSYVLMKEWVAPLSTRASTTKLEPAPLSAQHTTGNYSSYGHVGLEMDDIRPELTKGCVFSCAIWFMSPEQSIYCDFATASACTQQDISCKVAQQLSASASLGIAQWLVV